MWSLPDLNRLNDQAVKQWRLEKKKAKKDILKGQTCDVCGSNKPTEYKNYYDVFSDTPRGHIFLCEEHSEEIPEGYFMCKKCGRIHITNYSWENYFTDTEDGRFCLNCALNVEIAKESNWLGKKEVDNLTFEQVKKCKHLIPVEGKNWQAELEFRKNIELDNYNGGRLTGFSSCESSPDGGVRELKDICYKTLEEHDRVILILDGAYQFSVSIGVYTAKTKKLAKNKSASLCMAREK